MTYLSLARSFDAIAETYDDVYGSEANGVMAWMRQESLNLLRSQFSCESRLLEIGCGTGDEAVGMARYGCTIVATDVSPAMVAITSEKAAASGMAERVRCIALPAAGLGAIRPGASFDGAYASFGSLNCEPNLDLLANDLARLIRPGGIFVTSIMATVSPFEIAWCLAHLRPNQALRRLRPGWQHASIMMGREASKSLVSVPVHYLTAGAIQQTFAPHFEVTRTLSLGLLLPPPYLDEHYRRHHALWQRTMPLERWLRERWPFSGVGDHIAVVMRRR